MKNSRRAISALAILACAGAIPLPLPAQPTYPDKPIRIIVPYPPGAATDTVTRILAQKLSANIGQSVLVENRVGAGGSIGAEYVAKAPPDGYTLLMGTDATHAANPHLAAQPPYDATRDFTPISLVATNPIALVVHPSVPATSVNELLAWIKANPSRGSYGSSGTGTPHHLAGELLKVRGGVAITHVPYKGGGPAINDLLGGQIPMLFASAVTVIPHVQSGRVRVIGVTGTKRYEGLPQVPTIAESLEGFALPSWVAIFAPARLPEAVTRRLGDEFAKVLRDPEVRKKLGDAGVEVVGAGPAELGALQRSEFEQRGKLIRGAGIKGE